VAWKHALLLTRLSISGHVPAPLLRNHLDRIASDIQQIPQGSTRRHELAAAAFNMVLEDLGDDQRRIGMEWWLEKRDAFGGRGGEDIVRAKL
jgi:hypothetical protein